MIAKYFLVVPWQARRKPPMSIKRLMSLLLKEVQKEKPKKHLEVAAESLNTRRSRSLIWQERSSEFCQVRLISIMLLQELPLVQSMLGLTARLGGHYLQQSLRILYALFFPGLFFLLFSHLWWFRVLWLGSWIGFLGLGFSVDWVCGLWCWVFLDFGGWGSLYKYRRITLGKNFAFYTGSPYWHFCQIKIWPSELSPL